MADIRIDEVFYPVALEQQGERVVHTVTNKSMAGQLGVGEVTLHAFDGLSVVLTQDDMTYYEFAHLVLETFENIVSAWEDHYDFDA